jgi:hypothetical protein
MKIKHWKINFALVLAWLSGPMLTIPVNGIRGITIIEGKCVWGNFGSDRNAKIVGIVIFFLKFAIPLTVMIVSYTGILKKILRRKIIFEKYQDGEANAGISTITRKGKLVLENAKNI